MKTLIHACKKCDRTLLCWTRHVVIMRFCPLCYVFRIVYKRGRDKISDRILCGAATQILRNDTKRMTDDASYCEILPTGRPFRIMRCISCYTFSTSATDETGWHF